LWVEWVPIRVSNGVNNKPQEPEWSVSPFWSERQRVFVSLLAELAPFPGCRYADLAIALDAIQIESGVTTRLGRGRRALTRRALSRAFVAKALWNIPTTRAFRLQLIEDESLRATCGFWHGVPSEATFSRAYAEFASNGLGDQVLARVARQELGDTLVWHVARDSTAIQARELPLAKPKKEAQPKQKPGRRKGVVPKPKVPTRQERQLTQDAATALLELPTACDTGTKRNSKGHDVHWIGYKFHVDVTQDGLPISAVTTSASLHDSQVAIPLMKLTAQRTGCLFYQLMDAGYVGKPILQAARELGQVAIVAPKGNAYHSAIPLEPDRKMRYRIRTVVERFFSDLKDNRGGHQIRVKGHAKVHLHLMFGLLAIFASRILLT